MEGNDIIWGVDESRLLRIRKERDWVVRWMDETVSFMEKWREEIWGEVREIPTNIWIKEERMDWLHFNISICECTRTKRRVGTESNNKSDLMKKWLLKSGYIYRELYFNYADRKHEISRYIYIYLFARSIWIGKMCYFLKVYLCIYSTWKS
jgi:hypothetical protein